MEIIKQKLKNGNEFIVIKNLLELDFLNKLKETIFGSNFNWFFNPNMTESKDGYFFSHLLFKDFQIHSNFYIEFVLPILKKLQFVSLQEARINLMVKKEKLYQSDFHIDKPYPCKTAILYLNSCNGYTILDKKEQIKIECEENKAIIFDSQIEHSAVSQTDCERRIVINFNGF